MITSSWPAQKFQGLDFLLPLIDAMTDEDPTNRVAASEALGIFHETNAEVERSMMRRRLRLRNETIHGRIIAVAREGIDSLRYLMGQ